MPAIVLDRVTRAFGRRPAAALQALAAGRSKPEILAETETAIALDDVSLTVEPGGITMVMGLSGSGKSTLIRLVNRLIAPSAGRVLVEGTDIGALSRGALPGFRRGRIGMVFQSFGLMPHRTVAENVAYGLEVQGRPRAERAAKAAEWVAAVGLEGYEDAYPHRLSGGMRQRVGLARALAPEPRILLMDEAFSALDPLIRAEMQDLLLALHTRLRPTVMFVTHDLDEAVRLGDRVAILRDGRIVQHGAPSEILLRPADDHVRAFVAGVNRWRALPVRAAMEPAAPGLGAHGALQAGAPLEAALARVLAEAGPVPVSDARGEVLGQVSRAGLARLMASAQPRPA